MLLSDNDADTLIVHKAKYQAKTNPAEIMRIFAFSTVLVAAILNRLYQLDTVVGDNFLITFFCKTWTHMNYIFYKITFPKNVSG